MRIVNNITGVIHQVGDIDCADCDAVEVTTDRYGVEDNIVEVHEVRVTSSIDSDADEVDGERY